MAAGLHPSGSPGRTSRRMMAEINITPFVDVMLVLLIVFMVTAPLLVAGVAVDLPKVRADQLPSSQELALSVSVGPEGQLFMGSQKEPIPAEQLAARLAAASSRNFQERIFVRGDQAASYGNVMNALSLIQAAGFSNVALVTDPHPAIRRLRN